MPPAARITDMHVCPKVEPGPVPHVGGPITSSASTVKIGYLMAARATDSAQCVPAPDTIQMGAVNVFLDGQMAARIGDPCAHGGVVVSGFPTVNIGTTPQIAAMLAAAKDGIPFCEECERSGLAEATQEAP